MNHLVLSVELLERGAMRYTPAGIAALDVTLKHESRLAEAGHERKVAFEIRAVGLGDVAVPLAKLPVGAQFDASGFVASQRNGRGVVFHITQML